MTQPRRPRQDRRRAPRRPRPVRAISLGRLRIGFLLISMILSVFAVRLFQLQGVDAQAYVTKARAEGVVTVSLPATRGAITDRNGEPLAESVDGLMLVADPTVTVDNASQIATIIARRLGVDYFDVLQRLRKPYTRFQYVARRVPASKARAVVAELDKLGLKGVGMRRDPVRSYPGKDVAANVLGFLNDNGQAAGGAELAFDRLLSGKAGRATYEVGGGNRIPLGDNSTVPARSGSDLELTIDRDVQFYAQRVLRNAVQRSGSKTGSAVVMDTRTGQLLALADFPTFDANQPSLSEDDDLGIRAVREPYEPGSVEKVLTLSALLDERLVTPTTKVAIPPVLPVEDRVIHDWFDHSDLKPLRLNLTGVVSRSSNIGTVLAAQKLSDEQLYGYLWRFGLGQRTDIGMPGETAGILNDWQAWSPIDHATIAFGQGVSVNAVQMAAAVNAIANGGVRVDPSLVKGEATTSEGTVVGSDASTEHRVVSARAARQMAGMMEAVTNEETGTAGVAAVPGYRTAGKTGTAQRVGAKCRCYNGTFTASFAGFAPADAPRFTVYVVVQDPKNNGGGGSIGGPVFRKLMSYVLQKYAVPPTGSTPVTRRITWGRDQLH